MHQIIVERLGTFHGIGHQVVLAILGFLRAVGRSAKVIKVLRAVAIHIGQPLEVLAVGLVILNHEFLLGFGWLIRIFLFFNLMIGATPVFTAKIAGLMWLLVGYARYQTAPRSMPASASANAALPRESLS